MMTPALAAVPTAAALTFIALFLLGLTGLGIWHSRRIKDPEDFALAGRRLTAPVLIGTLIATWIGTGSIFGNAEMAYQHGWVILVLPLASAAGIVALSFIAPRVRAMPATTVPGILGHVFGPWARIIGALALIGAYLIIVSYQYRAGAAVLEAIIPGLDSWTDGVAASLMGRDWVDGLSPAGLATLHKIPGVIGFALFVILYTVLAGMVSVAWTDLINGILMAIGLLIAFGIVLVKFLEKDPGQIRLIENEPADILAVHWIGYLLPPLLLILGDANLMQRFMSASSPKVARRAAGGMFFGVLAMDWLIIAIAVMGGALLLNEPENHGHTVVEVAANIVHPAVGILLMATVIAVVVTTADSYLLGTATSTAADLTGKLPSPFIQRLIVIVLGLVALGLAFTSDAFFKVALYAYTLYGATLTPALLLALLRPRSSRIAAVSGMLAGLSVALLWKLILSLQGAGKIDLLPDALMELDAVLPALGVNILFTVGLAMILPKQPMPPAPDHPAPTLS